MIDFVERLQELLGEHNLTYQELAKQIQISRTCLYAWLKYKIPPKTQSLIKLAKFFNCPVDYFIGLTEETKITFSDNPVAFAERSMSLIQEKKITPYRVCKELHIETAMMTDWTKYGTLPSLYNLLMLTDYFNCSADYLLGLSDYK